MMPALWVAKTGLDAQQTNISVISNNLANASTVGYKKSRAVFEDLLYQNVNQPGGRSSADTTLPSGLMVGVGAAFDYYAGNIKRAPGWMQKTNLEWLYRLMQDPKRLWKRYFVTNSKFIWNATVRGK